MSVYVRVAETADSEEFVEIPTEENGTLLLDTITAQFPAAVGLRFNAESGAVRGVRCSEGVMNPPAEGWGDTAYFINKLPGKQALKRKLVEDDHPLPAHPEKRKYSKTPDLVMLNLAFTATEEDLKKHFQEYGDLDFCAIKYDADKKSRGFGFLRYREVKSIELALKAVHTIDNRPVELQIPTGLLEQIEGIQTKLFVGRIPKQTTPQDLRNYFGQYGMVKAAYIPQPFRGFGFIIFNSQLVAYEVLNASHIVNEEVVNVLNSSPSHGFGNQNRGFGNQNRGFGNQNRGFGNQNRGFGNQNRGFGNQNRGFGNQNQGFGNQNEGFGNQNPGFGNQNEGFGNQNEGFGNQDEGFGNQNQGFGNQNQGFRNQNQGFRNQNQGFRNQNPGFGNQNLEFGNQNLEFGNQNQGFGNQNQGFGKQNPGFGNQNPGFGNQNPGFGNQHQRFGIHGNNNMHGGNNMVPNNNMQASVGAGNINGYNNASGNYRWVRPGHDKKVQPPIPGIWTKTCKVIGCTSKDGTCRFRCPRPSSSAV